MRVVAIGGAGHLAASRIVPGNGAQKSVGICAHVKVMTSESLGFDEIIAVGVLHRIHLLAFGIVGVERDDGVAR